MKAEETRVRAKDIKVGSLVMGEHWPRFVLAITEEQGVSWASVEPRTYKINNMGFCTLQHLAQWSVRFATENEIVKFEGANPERHSLIAAAARSPRLPLNATPDQVFGAIAKLVRQAVEPPTSDTLTRGQFIASAIKCHDMTEAEIAKMIDAHIRVVAEGLDAAMASTEQPSQAIEAPQGPRVLMSLQQFRFLYRVSLGQVRPEEHDKGATSVTSRACSRYDWLDADFKRARVTDAGWLAMRAVFPEFFADERGDSEH